MKKTGSFFFQETTESESRDEAWQVHNVYTNYEINTITLMLRNINTKRILSIYTSSEDSYQRVYINGRRECYHRVIVLHFIPNPDPEKYTQVNHKNHIRNDNRIENLEWCTRSDNQKDRQPYTHQKRKYIKELPEGCLPITKYKDFTFDGCYYNPKTEEILKSTKGKYQIISPKGKKFHLIDTNKVHHLFGHQKFVKTFQA